MFLVALAITALQPPPQPAEVDIIRDPITDRVRAYATVRDDGHRVVVSCDPSEYSGARVTVHSRRWLERGNALTGERAMTYRFDEMAPQRTNWDIKDRHGRIMSRGRAVRFINTLADAEQLVIRTRDVEHHEFDMIFRLRDVRTALVQALAACSGSPIEQ